MGKTMTKVQLFAALAEKTGLQKKEVALVFETYHALVLSELKKGGEMKLPDLGKFKVRKSAARMGRNPKTGKPIKIAAKTKAKFLVSKAVKESILKVK